MRAITMKCAERRASRPALIFSQNDGMSSRTCARSVPKSEFCFSPVLSSIMHALTPISSSVRTVNLKISG